MEVQKLIAVWYIKVLITAFGVVGEICKMDFLSKFPFQLLCSQELSSILWTCAALDMQSGVPKTSGALNRALLAPYQVGILLYGGCLCVPYELSAAAVWVTTEKSKNIEAKVLVFLRASVHYAFFFFCFLISSTPRAVHADWPTALCNLPERWTGTVVY